MAFQAACSKHHVYYQKVYSSPLINHHFNVYTQTIPFSTKILFLCNCQFFSLPRQSADYTITFPFNTLFSVPIKHNHASSSQAIPEKRERTDFQFITKTPSSSVLLPVSSHQSQMECFLHCSSPYFQGFFLFSFTKILQNMTAAGSTYLILFCITYPLFFLSVSYTSFFSSILFFFWCWLSYTIQMHFITLSIYCTCYR